MNENKLRLAIRKELKRIDESTEVASQIVSGFNQASATPEQVLYALEIITGALAGTAFLAAWTPMKNYIMKIYSGRKMTKTNVEQ
jgi:hypothetical protein